MKKSQAPVFLIVITAALSAFVFSCFSLRHTDDKTGAQIEKTSVPEFHASFIAEEENGDDENHVKKTCPSHLLVILDTPSFALPKRKASPFEFTRFNTCGEKFLLHRQLLI